MSMGFKKNLLKRYTYVPLEKGKNHKHNYSLEYLLEITNQNRHASGNYYLKKERYIVLKCDSCDSFIPKSQEGNYSGLIFVNDDIPTHLPLIMANTHAKNPAYQFADLESVRVYNNKE